MTAMQLRGRRGFMPGPAPSRADKNNHVGRAALGRTIPQIADGLRPRRSLPAWAGRRVISSRPRLLSLSPKPRSILPNRRARHLVAAEDGARRPPPLVRNNEGVAVLALRFDPVSGLAGAVAAIFTFADNLSLQASRRMHAAPPSTCSRYFGSPGSIFKNAAAKWPESAGD